MKTIILYFMALIGPKAKKKKKKLSSWEANLEPFLLLQ
jgi:hypothetical protein